MSPRGDRQAVRRPRRPHLGLGDRVRRDADRAGGDRGRVRPARRRARGEPHRRSRGTSQIAGPVRRAMVVSKEGRRAIPAPSIACERSDAPGCGSTLEPKSTERARAAARPARRADAVGGRGDPVRQPAPADRAGARRRRRRRRERGTELSDGRSTRGFQRRSAGFEGRHPDRHLAGVRGARARWRFSRCSRRGRLKEWERARPFETDALFQTHRFWMERYAAFALVNRVEQVVVTRVALVKIDVDAFYESITVRIFARRSTGPKTPRGKVVGGSKTAARASSRSTGRSCARSPARSPRRRAARRAGRRSPRGRRDRLRFLRRQARRRRRSTGSRRGSSRTMPIEGTPPYPGATGRTRSVLFLWNPPHAPPS